jgi:predicted nuclease of predicted toxin-antitoxin system
MARFLVDEDLPRRIARLAAARGADAVHVLDVGLRGEPDPIVLAAAVAAGRTLADN